MVRAKEGSVNKVAAFGVAVLLFFLVIPAVRTYLEFCWRWWGKDFKEKFSDRSGED